MKHATKLGSKSEQKQSWVLANFRVDYGAESEQHTFRVPQWAKKQTTNKTAFLLAEVWVGPQQRAVYRTQHWGLPGERVQHGFICLVDASPEALGDKPRVETRMRLMVGRVFPYSKLVICRCHGRCGTRQGPHFKRCSEMLGFEGPRFKDR